MELSVIIELSKCMETEDFCALRVNVSQLKAVCIGTNDLGFRRLGNVLNETKNCILLSKFRYQIFRNKRTIYVGDI
jgi:hypothetical protein